MIRRLKVLYLSIVLIIISLNNIFSQESNKKIPSEKPKLIIGIVIDQMRYDYIYRFWEKYQDNGFKRLIKEGTFCSDARINYFFAENCVGNATIVTGTYPAYHGIVSSEWYNYLEDKIINCTEDPRYKTIGGNYENGKKSPKNLLSTTFGDELKLSNNFKSKVISIALDANSAILAGGHTANAAYWYDDITGNWVTNSFYSETVGDWVMDFNKKDFPSIYLGREWTTLLPLADYTESLKDTNTYEVGFNGRNYFPYNLAFLSNLNRNKQDYSLLKYTPFGNSFTKDFAISAIVAENLGKDEFPDFLALGFSATEYIGQKFGPNSVEIEDTYLRLDKEIGFLIDFIESELGKENVLIYLTSNSGVSYIPGYLKDSKIPGGYFNASSAMSLVKSYLNVVYGEGDWIKFYHDQQLFLNRKLIEDSKIPLEDIQMRIAQFLIQFEGVANAVTATTMQSANFESGVLEKIQNCYNPKYSGDIMINLKPGWVEKSGNSTAHLSSYSYDTHVPLIWYGWKVGRDKIERPIDLIDIAPTISSFLNITYPGACIGIPIQELIK